MIDQNLIKLLRANFALDWQGIHGAPHWARVRQNGLMLSEMTGANTRVVEAFAFVHDSCRIDDGLDPDHGVRASNFAQELVASGHLPLNSTELEQLVTACRLHSDGRAADTDITICTCWDADRLDLGRTGVKPAPAYLSTDAARSSALIEWAYKRSLQGSTWKGRRRN
jgi:uncharacterized protein